MMNEILNRRIEDFASGYAESMYKNSTDGERKAAKHDVIKGAEFILCRQWISVEEALPEMEKEVVLFNKNSIRHYEIGWLRKEKGCSKSKWAITNGFVEDDDITHWMPIPKFEPNKTE